MLQTWTPSKGMCFYQYPDLCSETPLDGRRPNTGGQSYICVYPSSSTSDMSRMLCFGLEHESFFVFDVVLEFVPGAQFGFRLPDRARCTEHPSDRCKARGGDAQLKIGFGFGETSITFWETSLQTRQLCAWASTLFCLTEIQGVDGFLDIFAHFLS